MRIAGVLAVLVLLGGGAAAEPPEVHDVRGLYLHSDLPLPRGDRPAWAHYCSSPDPTIIVDGVCTRFGFGDWMLTRPACEDIPCKGFIRLDALGFAYGYSEGEERYDLGGPGIPSIIFKLEADEASILYALQIGYRGGSRYLLLTAAPDPDGEFRQMAILDARCLKLAHVQWRHPTPTRYDDRDDEAHCAVNSLAALVAIAREAKSRPPRAIMTFLGKAKEDE